VIHVWPSAKDPARDPFTAAPFVPLERDGLAEDATGQCLLSPAAPRQLPFRPFDPSTLDFVLGAAPNESGHDPARIRETARKPAKQKGLRELIT